MARIQQIEHFYMKMLQDKVWRDLRLDVVQPDRPNAAYMPPIDKWWATKQRMVQPPEELRKRAAAAMVDWAQAVLRLQAERCFIAIDITSCWAARDDVNGNGSSLLLTHRPVNCHQP